MPGSAWSAQALSGQALKRAQRRAGRIDHGVDRQIEGLFESVTAGDGGVHDAVGEYDPGRTGREHDLAARPGSLIAFIELGRIMKRQHHGVVWRAARLCYLQLL